MRKHSLIITIPALIITIPDRYTKQLALCLVLVSCIFSTASAQRPWHIDQSEAVAEAMKQQRPILLVFSGSDWCRPCINLKKEVFDTDEFKQFAEEELVLLLADFPRKKKNKPIPEQQRLNEDLARRHNQNGEFPLLLLLDPHGQLIVRIPYQNQDPGNFIQQLHALLPDS